VLNPRAMSSISRVHAYSIIDISSVLLSVKVLGQRGPLEIAEIGLVSVFLGAGNY
jgi:hypothetical protein